MGFVKSYAGEHAVFYGIDSVSISHRFGHAHVSTTTDIYSHVIKEAEDRISDCAPDAIIIEFKVREAEEEASLQDTVQAALQQIEERRYEQVLTAKGMEKDRVRKYGFAFEGKRVLIGR